MQLFKNPLLNKILTLGLLIGLLLIPLYFIQNVIEERKQYRTQVIQELEKLFPSRQEIIGPVIVVPYIETKKTLDDDGKPTNLTYKVNHQKIIFPETLSVTKSQMNVQMRHRNNYQVPSYEYQGQWQAHYQGIQSDTIQKDIYLAHPNATLEIGTPILIIGLSDERGLTRAPVATINGVQLEWKQQKALKNFKTKNFAIIPSSINTKEPFNVLLDFAIIGLKNFNVVPIANQTEFKLQANWAHPKFDGQFMPVARTINNKEFNAQWSIPSISNDAQQELIQQIESTGNTTNLPNLGIELVQPIDIYTQSERAIKYGILFILLTFVVFVLIEVTKKLNIHPVQYTLIGSALAIFFLMLISLSEQITFLPAYIISACACITLLIIYLNSVLKSFKNALGMGGFFVTLYASLYGLLQAENFAFLLGSLLLFGFLSLIMIATRNIDWYQFALPSIKTDLSNNKDDSIQESPVKEKLAEENSFEEDTFEKNSFEEKPVEQQMTEAQQTDEDQTIDQIKTQ